MGAVFSILGVHSVFGEVYSVTKFWYLNNMVVDMEVDMVANMVVDIEAEKVDKGVADKVADELA